MSLPARHELTIRIVELYAPLLLAECTCMEWSGVGSHDQILEDYQVHRDEVDDAERFESQRLDNAAAHDVNLGAK